MPLLAVLGVPVLPEEHFRSGFFWEEPSLVFPYSAVPWFTEDTVHASVAGAFGYFSHISSV